MFTVDQRRLSYETPEFELSWDWQLEKEQSEGSASIT